MLSRSLALLGTPCYGLGVDYVVLKSSPLVNAVGRLVAGWDVLVR
jgi:hypothetical protein